MKNRLFRISALFITLYVVYRLITGAPHVSKAYNEILAMTINRPENYNDVRLSELWGGYYVNIYHIKRLVPESSTVYFPSGYLDAQVDGIAAQYFLYPRQIKEYTSDDIDTFLKNDIDEYLFIYYSDLTLFGPTEIFSFPDSVNANPELFTLPNTYPERGLVII